MPRSSKPRKARKIKSLSTNVLSDVFGGMGSTHGAHLRAIQIKNYKALDDMAFGRGTREGWDLLRGAVNMACVMCDQGIGAEYSDAMVTAKDALLEVGKRLVKLGRVVLKAEELAAFREALSIHDAQLENIRAIDVERAYFEVRRRERERVNTISVMRAIQIDEEQREAA